MYLCSLNLLNKMGTINLLIHPLVAVIERIFDSYSDILENIVGIYTDNSSELQIYSHKKKLPATEDLLEWISEQQKIMLSSPIWIDPNKLRTYKKNDLHICTACVIYLNSFYEKDTQDLIILYLKFTENALCGAAKDLSLHDKNLFARLMEAGIKTMLSREYEVYNWAGEIEKRLNNARFMLQHKKNEQQQKLNFAHYILGNLGKEHDIHISLTKEAERIILDFEGDIQEIENELIAAVNLSVSYSTEDIVLDDFSLIGLETKNIEDSKTASSGKSISNNLNKKTGRYSKAEAFLNRLEGAAKAIKLRDEKINGKSIAEQLSIKPPAINDGINRYHDYIVKMIQKEPLRWPLLDNLRPIQTIRDSLS